MPTELQLIIKRELLRTVRNNLFLSAIALILVLGVVSIVFYHKIESIYLLIWFFSNVLIVTVRQFLINDYNNALDEKRINKVDKKFKLLTLLSVTLISCMFVVLALFSSAYEEAFLGMIIAGLSSGSVMILSYDTKLIRNYLIIMIVPFALVILFTDVPSYKYLSFLMFLFLVMLVLFSKRYNRNMIDSIKAQQAILQAKKALELSQKKIERLAYYDTLTNLPNRTTLYEHLKLHLSKLHRNKQYGAIFFIDLDKFKEINDTVGHSVGDEVLKQFAKIIKTTLRNEDLIARFGGDEFIVLLATQKNDYASIQRLTFTVAQKIHDAMRTPIIAKEHSLVIRGSIGIKIIAPDETNIEHILSHADMAMYAAKQSADTQTSLFKNNL